MRDEVEMLRRVTATIVTTPVARCLGSATLIAVMVIGSPVTVDGDVNMPLVEIEPSEVDQMTAELLAPVTVAVKCSCPSGASDVEEGEIAIRISPFD